MMPSKVWTLSALAVTALLALPNPIAAETVTCSYYSANYNSRRTANGQIFSNDALTAASLTLPFGTRVKLINPKNGHSVVVRVNDRGPNVKGRDISVTRRAAGRLGMLHAGVLPLDMETVNSESAGTKVKSSLEKAGDAVKNATVKAGKVTAHTAEKAADKAIQLFGFAISPVVPFVART